MRTSTVVIASSCLLTAAASGAPRMFDFEVSARFGGVPFESPRVIIDGQTFFPSNLDSDPNPVVASAASREFGLLNMNVSGRFSYDTAQAPFGGSSYRGTGFQLDVTLPDGGGAFTLSKSDPVITIRNDTAIGDSISVSTAFEALDAPLVLPNTPEAIDTTAIDLLSDDEIAMNAPGLPALSNLWVRLTPPTEIEFQTMSLSLRDPTGTALDSTDLPGSINLGDFGPTQSVMVFQFISSRGVEVNRDDYLTDADFQLASDWVDEYLDGIEIGDVMNFNIDTLVPAPGAGVLLAGAGLAALRRRR